MELEDNPGSLIRNQGKKKRESPTTDLYHVETPDLSLANWAHAEEKFLEC
jgi:hypothetical protein